MLNCYHWLQIEKPLTSQSEAFLKCTCILRVYFCLF
nr:MAG TPA_asm: hypothetical protein [Caudoviricetes sp.]